MAAYASTSCCLAPLQACRPITVPTHSAIPIVRYETGLPKEAIEATIAQDRAAARRRAADRRDVQLRAERRAGDELQPKTSAAQAWSNQRLPGFERPARNRTWSAMRLPLVARRATNHMATLP